MMPSFEEYQKALLVVGSYEEEQKRIRDENLKLLKVELSEYFANNLIDGRIRLVEFKMSRRYFNDYDIIPVKPTLDENYEGGNDDDIKKIGEKYGIECGIVYWCYHK